MTKCSEMTVKTVQSRTWSDIDRIHTKRNIAPLQHAYFVELCVYFDTQLLPYTDRYSWNLEVQVRSPHRFAALCLSDAQTIWSTLWVVHAVLSQGNADMWGYSIISPYGIASSTIKETWKVQGSPAWDHVSTQIPVPGTLRCIQSI